jgi:hypothetical protein
MVERLEAWEIKVPADYDPGWPYKRQQPPADLFAKLKTPSLQDAKALAMLLNIPEYSAALKIVREFNELPPEKQDDKAARDRYRRADQTMQRIEKEHHVDFMPHQPLDEPK